MRPTGKNNPKEAATQGVTLLEKVQRAPFWGSSYPEKELYFFVPFFCLRCVCLFYVLLFFPLSFTRARWGPVCGFVSFIGEMGSHVAPAGGFNTFFKLALFLSGVSLREQLQHNLTSRIALGKCCWTQQLCVHPHVHLFPCGSHWKVF